MELSHQRHRAVAETIASYKGRCFLGEFKSADQILSTLPEHCVLDPKYASEIARMQIRQGAYSSAAGVLDRVWQREHGELDKLEWLLVEVQRQYLSICLDGTLRESMQRSANVWQQYFKGKDFLSMTDTMVCLFSSFV
jgi:hypothetical protein